MDREERALLDAISPSKHVLERTSPKGERFVGRCVRCGQAGLPAVSAREPCPGQHTGPGTRI